MKQQTSITNKKHTVILRWIITRNQLYLQYFSHLFHRYLLYYSEISKTKLTVGQIHKQQVKYIKMVPLLNSAP